MRNPYAWLDARRLAPRVDVETFCSEVVGSRDHPGLVIDLSAEGARLERPYAGGGSPREIVLELEVPEVDEIIWVRGEVCFDQLRQAPAGQGGPMGLLRTTGLRLVSAAARDLRMLRDCVFELYRSRHRPEHEEPSAALVDAACYARG
jgi:hypothetical protein